MGMGCRIVSELAIGKATVLCKSIVDISSMILDAFKVQMSVLEISPEVF